MGKTNIEENGNSHAKLVINKIYFIVLYQLKKINNLRDVCSFNQIFIYF